MTDQRDEVAMGAPGHGGARPGAGRKPKDDRKVKRSVTLSAAADGLVQAAKRGDESYSQTLDRLLCTLLRPADGGAARATDVAVLVATLGGSRKPVAAIYRRLSWSRQRFEQVVQNHRAELTQAGVRLHVATKDAASGRREQYITVDGIRYSALSRDLSSGRSSPYLEAAE
ncbi:MAG: hypothetical protein M3380_18050 [Chloroflexota bacterium]|nr:hypothetical protein [Chloroflexota bacterium]